MEQIRNKLFTASRTKSDSLTACLDLAIARLLASLPGTTIRITDTPPKTHKLNDITPSNPMWAAYRQRQARLSELEQQEQAEREQRHKQWIATRFGRYTPPGL